MDKLALDPKKVESLRSDYNILKLTAHQVSNLDETMKAAMTLIDIDPVALQTHINGVCIEWQKEHQMFYNEVDSMNENEKLIHQQKLIEKGLQRLKPLLLNPEDGKKLPQILESILKWHLDRLLKSKE